MKKKLIIAIDGYVATGKGTTAKGVAKALWYTYLDTGAMYRAVTLYVVRQWLIDASKEEKIALMDHIELEFSYNTKTDTFDMILNGENVEKEIRKISLAENLHKIITIPEIRQKLVALQQNYGKDGWVVVDGRDIWTVVFPQADLKIFLVCDLEVRVLRRMQQLAAMDLPADEEKIRQDISVRDQTDYLGEHAVNKMADDAIMIDTSHITIHTQIEKIVALAHSVL
jgi:cytidylate kinase